MKKHNLNHEIRSTKVLLIEDDGTKVGPIDLREAQQLANQRGEDLVEVSANKHQSVCKIYDYGREQYRLKKTSNTAQKMVTKEIKFRPVTGTNDLKTKAQNALKSLDRGNQVKVVVFFKGRENTHPEVGFEALDNFVKMLKGKAVLESKPKKQGNQIVATLCKNENIQDKAQAQG